MVGADATAAAALDRLRKFHADHVGTDWKNSVKPLGRATRSVELRGRAARGRSAEITNVLSALPNV